MGARELAQCRGRGIRETAPIPPNSISKPPSAELRPGQTDQDSPPPYETLDAILELYVAGAQGRAQLIEAGFDEAVVDRVVSLVDRAEWKRRQFAPGPSAWPRARPPAAHHEPVARAGLLDAAPLGSPVMSDAPTSGEISAPTALAPAAAGPAPVRACGSRTCRP